MQQHDQPRLDLSVSQVVAASLAAVSAACVGSLLGVAGTLLGAAVTSIVATVGAALYNYSLGQAQARIRQRRTRGPDGVALQPDVRRGMPRPRVPPMRRPRPRAWRRVAGMAALVCAVALGAITVLEVVVVQQPLAAVIGHAPAAPARTSLGAVVRTRPAGAPTGTTPTPAASRQAPAVIAPTDDARAAPSTPDGPTPTSAGPTPTRDGPTPTAPSGREDPPPVEQDPPPVEQPEG